MNKNKLESGTVGCIVPTEVLPLEWLQTIPVGTRWVWVDALLEKERFVLGRGRMSFRSAWVWRDPSDMRRIYVREEWIV